jgi:hypothetical protein
LTGYLPSVVITSSLITPSRASAPFLSPLVIQSALTFPEPLTLFRIVTCTHLRAHIAQGSLDAGAVFFVLCLICCDRAAARFPQPRDRRHAPNSRRGLLDLNRAHPLIIRKMLNRICCAWPIRESYDIIDYAPKDLCVTVGIHGIRACNRY